MDSDSIISLIAMVICLIFSAYFSATETAFSTCNRIRLKTLADDGNRRAKQTLRICEKYDKMLSTILVGNNIVNITLSSLATVFFIKHIGDIGATVSTIVVTIVVLIFGEISPKSLAKESPDRFAMWSTPFLRVFLWILTPINFVFSQWKKLLSKLIVSKEDSGITEEELRTIIEEAEEDGEIDEQESALIQSAISFANCDVMDIVTPRVDVVGIEKTASKKEVAAVFAETEFSRLPVYDETLDNIVGTIHQRDFYNRVFGKDCKLEEIIQPPIIVPETMKINTLLKQFQKDKNHMAIVADEYGGTEGIVTMEDILEELVGEIWDEHDEIVEEIVEIEENKYRVLCNTDLDDVFTFFSISADTEMTTVSGWVMEQLGKIPEVDDTYDYENLHVVVTKVEQRRVSEIIIEVSPKTEEE